jgi:hypothetical protein
MGYRQLNLQTFNIDKDNIKEGLVGLFDLDSDYNGDNGDEYWEFSDQDDENGNPISLAVLEGFKTEAERFVDGIYFDIVNEAQAKNEEPTMQKMIASTLYKIQECHGSYSSQFTFNITETDNEFVVAVSYLT